MYVDDALQQIEAFEARIPWMYLDPEGNVTVGVGLMLPDVAAAQALTFYTKGTTANYAASVNAIAADYSRVKASSMGFSADYYYWPNSCILDDADITALLRKVVVANDAELASHFPNYADFPDPAKLALLDMAYNLGPERLFSEYIRMGAAVGEQEWLQCAADCGRDSKLPAFAKRNAWTRAQFRAAFVLSGKPPAVRVA